MSSRKTVIFLLLLFLILYIYNTTSFASQALIYVIEVKGPINPIVTKYFERVLKKAIQDKAECLVVELDTPGGLLTSMRTILQDIVNSPLPIVMYVYPRGAQSASAGVFITMAAHIAAMAPNTNIGAAHPVMIGGGGEEPKLSNEMKEKITNDAVALIKTTTEQRGRNVAWAEKAVRKSISATEKEALKLKVIDIVAVDLKDLLKQINNRKVVTIKGKVTLHTKPNIIEFIPMSSQERFLHTLSDPNLAYILLTLGIYGLIYELASPGAILPGVVGGICLILALFSLGSLPVNYAGLGLILLSFILFILDIKAPTHGILTIGGVISMTLGSLMLFNADMPYYQVSKGLIGGVVLFTLVFFLIAIGAVVHSMKKPSVTGKEGLIGEIAVVRNRLSPKGKVFVMGEIWQAVSDDGSYVEEGEEVVIKKVEGFKLFVKPISKEERRD